ncbi:hypothetical protein Tco_0867223 [Tanacetum coccineum]
MPDETPRERSGTGKEDVNMEDSNYEATNHVKEASTSSSDDFIIIARTWKHVKNGIKALGGRMLLMPGLPDDRCGSAGVKLLMTLADIN